MVKCHDNFEIEDVLVALLKYVRVVTRNINMPHQSFAEMRNCSDAPLALALREPLTLALDHSQS